MRTQSTDTNPIIEEKLINLLRQCSVTERLSKVFSLSSFTLNLSKRALARKNPQMNKLELDLLFVKLNYSEDIYNKLRNYYSNILYEEK